jgi:hypothetical protein
MALADARRDFTLQVLIMGGAAMAVAIPASPAGSARSRRRIQLVTRTTGGVLMGGRQPSKAESIRFGTHWPALIAAYGRMLAWRLDHPTRRNLGLAGTLTQRLIASAKRPSGECGGPQHDHSR